MEDPRPPLRQAHQDDSVLLPKSLFWMSHE
jgi:hypothetical protein